MTRARCVMSKRWRPRSRNTGPNLAGVTTKAVEVGVGRRTRRPTQPLTVAPPRGAHRRWTRTPDGGHPRSVEPRSRRPRSPPTGARPSRLAPSTRCWGGARTMPRSITSPSAPTTRPAERSPRSTRTTSTDRIPDRRHCSTPSTVAWPPTTRHRPGHPVGRKPRQVGTAGASGRWCSRHRGDDEYGGSGDDPGPGPDQGEPATAIPAAATAARAANGGRGPGARRRARPPPPTTTTTRSPGPGARGPPVAGRCRPPARPTTPRPWWPRPPNRRPGWPGW